MGGVFKDLSPSGRMGGPVYRSREVEEGERRRQWGEEVSLGLERFFSGQEGDWLVLRGMVVSSVAEFKHSGRLLIRRGLRTVPVRLRQPWGSSHLRCCTRIEPSLIT